MTTIMKKVYMVTTHAQDGEDNPDPTDLSNSQYIFSNEKQAEEFYDRMEKVFTSGSVVVFYTELNIDDPEYWEELKQHEQDLKEEQEDE